VERKIASAAISFSAISSSVRNELASQGKTSATQAIANQDITGKSLTPKPIKKKYYLKPLCPKRCHTIACLGLLVKLSLLYEEKSKKYSSKGQNKRNSLFW